MQTPPPPPPPPEFLFHDRDGPGSPSFHNDVCAMEATPLIGSRSARKKQQDRDPPQETPLQPKYARTLHRIASQSDDDVSVSTTSSVSSFSTVSSLAENFKESLLLPFTDEDGTNVGRGLSALAAIGTLLGVFLVFLHPAKTGFLHYLSSICGYNYLILWSVCFYPQVIQNYRRQSTQGVSQDFALLNFMGWSYYSIYMSSLFFQPKIRQLYEQRFHEKSTVALNDVLFSVHAMILAFFYIVQILYYSSKRHSKHSKTTPSCSCPTLKLKTVTKLLVLAMGLPTVVMPILILSHYKSMNWLDYLYMLSFFKIACTLTKYSKQVYHNYKRSSTKGWNIWYNFLEASGGSLSMVQIILDAIIIQDLSGITGNLAKFLLGLATLIFDGIFFMQHYVWYASKEEEEETPEDHQQDPTQKIPKHLRASSRFEIVISSPVVSHPHQYGGEPGPNHHPLLLPVEESAFILHAEGDLSVDGDSASRTSENFMVRL